MDPQGRIFTRNRVEVFRVLKGQAEYAIDVITEGGVFGNTMQMVTPSTQFSVGDYGLIVLNANQHQDTQNTAISFMSINEKTGRVSGTELATDREELYEAVATITGSNVITLKRIPLNVFKPKDGSDVAITPVIDQISPLQITAGTRSIITISGSGFGATQSDGVVAFRNADDGGLSFIDMANGPHYVSWSDTEIQLYVPSASLYNTQVAGTGTIRVVNGEGGAVESEQQITVKYAKSEVVYSEVLNETMLVGMENGGYVFQMNERMETLLGNSELVENAITKWACNSGVNFHLDTEITDVSDYAHDEINLIGLSDSGQLPNYVLGKTVTTFSGCGTPEGLQWNLIEVDVLLNSDIDWWISEGPPAQNRFDIQTSLLHELGHAHLLQHNNNTNSPMYFQLMAGTSRRNLHPISDVNGGSFVTSSSVEAEHTCGENQHDQFDPSNCDLSVINGVDEKDVNGINVYPNPFSDQLNIVSNSLETNYSLTDISGRIVMQGMTSESETALSTHLLPNGMYLLTISSENERSVAKVVKN